MHAIGQAARAPLLLLHALAEQAWRALPSAGAPGETVTMGAACVRGCARSHAAPVYADATIGSDGTASLKVA